MPFKGREYLARQLAAKRPRVWARYRYYEMKNGIQYVKTVIPSEMLWMAETLGWCAKAVDSLADRLDLRRFRNDDFRIEEIYAMNNMDILPDAAMLESMIGSCAFIYISEDMNGYPRLQVIDAENATGIKDTVTGMLSEGYAVLRRNDDGKEELTAYFTPGRTEYWEHGKMIRVDTNDAPYPLLVPIVYRPDAKRPFGHSRISRACMSIQQGALRTLLRSEVSAEFYSFPQKWITGLSADAESLDKWKATVSSLLSFSKDDEGESPKLGQFTQASMQPFIEQMRAQAALFAGETGLTTDDLGFVSDNPSSSEAIKASHESLRLLARKAQKTFGSGFVNAGYLAACVRDKFPYERKQLYRTKCVWAPVFEPDASVLSAIGDGAFKINQAIPGYFGEESLYELTGIESEREDA